MSNIKTAIEATFDANPNGFRDSIHAEIIDKIQAAIQAKKEEMAHSFLNFGEQQDDVVEEEVEQIDETMTRKHFQLVANTVREIEDPKKRQELANHHAKIFAASNPRFDHARFHQACGTQIHEEVESIDEMEETPKHQREKTPNLPKTDRAAVEARKAREAAKERIEARKRDKAAETGY